MSKSTGDASGRSEKEAYLKTLKARLDAKVTQLANVKQRVARATDSHRIDASEQLRNAERRADAAMATMAKRLKKLQDADDDNWEDLVRGTDLAWEDLAQSIKRVVARFP